MLSFPIPHIPHRSLPDYVTTGPDELVLRNKDVTPTIVQLLKEVFLCRMKYAEDPTYGEAYVELEKVNETQCKEESPTMYHALDVMLHGDASTARIICQTLGEIIEDGGKMEETLVCFKNVKRSPCVGKRPTLETQPGCDEPP